MAEFPTMAVPSGASAGSLSCPESDLNRFLYQIEMHNPSIIQGLGWVILLFLYISQVTQEAAVPIRIWVLPQMAVAQGLGPDLSSCVTLPCELASPSLSSLICVGWSNTTSQGHAWHAVGPASCQHLSQRTGKGRPKKREQIGSFGSSLGILIK